MYFTPESIDNGIFEAIRTRLVENGHLPDITTFSNAENFETAKKSLDENLIKLFPVGHRYERGELDGNVIIISRMEETDGEAGFTELDEAFDEQTQLFHGRPFPKQSINVEYDIRYITQRSEMSYKIEAILRQVFDKKGSLTAYNADETEEGVFRYVKTQVIDTSDAENIERGFRIEARDIFLHKNPITESAAPLQSGGVAINL